MFEFFWEWRDYYTNPALIAFLAVITSFTTLAMIGEPNELNYIPHHDDDDDDERYKMTRKKKINHKQSSLLKFVWDLVVFPDKLDLSQSYFLTYFPEDEQPNINYTQMINKVNNQVIHSDDLWLLNKEEKERRKKKREEEEEEEDDDDEEDLFTSTYTSVGSSVELEYYEDSDEYLSDDEDVALTKKLKFYEEKITRLQEELIRIQNAAELCHITMKRERELRIAAEEEMRMYKDTIEDQYETQQQMRELKSQLRESMMRESQYKQEIKDLKRLIDEEYIIENEEDTSDDDDDEPTFEKSESEDYTKGYDDEVSSRNWKSPLNIFG